MRAVGPLRMPRSIEVTYLRRDRCPPVMPEARLPHPLDRDNVPGRPASILSADWGEGGRLLAHACPSCTR